MQTEPGSFTKKFFEEIKVVAVVGYSDKEERPGHYVPEYLAEHGYKIIAVNPKYDGSVDGHPAYASLAEIPADMQVDVVDVFRAPEHAEGIVREAAAMQNKPTYIVFQPGAENEDASELAQEHGIKPLDICMMAAHRML